MPWPKRFHLQPGSLQTGTEVTTPARRTNRHQQRNIVFCQALSLEQEEREWLERYWVSDDEIRVLPLRGVRRQGESDGAVMACNDYLQLPRRSLVKLHRQWQNDHSRGITCLVPTLDTFKSWSRCYQWQARALLFDMGHIRREGIHD